MARAQAGVIHVAGKFPLLARSDPRHHSLGATIPQFSGAGTTCHLFAHDVLRAKKRHPLSHLCVDKRTVDNYGGLRTKLLREISAFLASKLEELNAYDKLKIYYDNGQSDVIALLREGFKPFGARTEFVEDVTPGKYRLFQAADMIATLELVRAKLKADGRISSSEKGFFESVQKLNRVYLKPLSRKLWI